MRIVTFLVAFLVANWASHVLADDEVFDVPNGNFQTKYSGALALGTLVSCKFTIDDVYFGSRWVPMVSILFTVDEESSSWGKSFRLAAIRVSKENGWRHELDVSHGDDRESTISMYSGLSETVLPLTLWWDDSQKIIAFVGDDPSHMSMIDVLDYSFSSWQANLSGVKGSGDCDSRILGGDDDDLTGGDEAETD